MSTPEHSPSNPPFPGHLPTRTEQKRPRISEKKRKRAALLEQKLRFLQDEFSEAPLTEILRQAIEAAHRLSETTRPKDREAVLLILETYACAVSLEEIIDDTGLSRWVVKGILIDFISHALVKVVKQHDPAPGVAPGAPVLLYALTHTAIGSDLSLSQGASVSLVEEFE